MDKGGIGMGGDESGWKQVHGEVFRRPPHLMLFSALIGTGYQLIVIVLLTILSAITFTMYAEGGRGSFTFLFIAIYAVSSFASGYTSGAYYRSHFYPEADPKW
jgi:transmembrane 9 superfamily protein 3